jgi:hypothetical protein
MKKIILILAFLLIIPSVSMADGSVTVSQDSISADGSVLVIKLACVGDAANGSVPATTITAADVAGGMIYDYQKMGFYFYEIWTVAGATTAPDAADITVNDAKGAEMFDQDNVIAATGTTEGTVDKYRAVTSLLTVTTANQGTVDATWDVYIKLVK